MFVLGRSFLASVERSPEEVAKPVDPWVDPSGLLSPSREWRPAAANAVWHARRL
jgi:hypothetical protein